MMHTHRRVAIYRITTKCLGQLQDNNDFCLRVLLVPNLDGHWNNRSLQQPNSLAGQHFGK